MKAGSGTARLKIHRQNPKIKQKSLVDKYNLPDELSNTRREDPLPRKRPQNPSTSPLPHILPQHPHQAAGALRAEVQTTDAITDVDPVLGLTVEAVANDVEGNRLRVVLHDHGPRRAGSAGVVVNVLTAGAVARNTADAGAARAGIPLGTVRVLAVTSTVTATRGTITPASTSVGTSAFTVSTSTGTVAVNPGTTAAPTPPPAALSSGHSVQPTARVKETIRLHD